MLYGLSVFKLFENFLMSTENPNRVKNIMEPMGSFKENFVQESR